MNQELVSIIISVYNIENYLPHCLKSIEEQTYNELEIILVDDGSSDLSGAICDDFAKKDSRCIVIHQTNQGAGPARNSGKRIAKGNYLFFMDGDDYMHKDTIRIMYEAINANEKYDIAVIDWKKTYNFDEDTTTNNDKENVSILSGHEMINKLFGDDYNMGFAGYLWNKLYRRNIIEQIWMKQYKRLQDFDFNLRVLYNTKSVVHIHEELYFYVQRSSSLVNNPKTAGLSWHYITDILYQNYIDQTPEQRKEYGHLLLDKLYLTMLYYKDASWKTEEQAMTFAKCKKIVATTLKPFIINKRMSLIKKIYRLVLLNSVQLTSFMMYQRKWKR